MSVYDNLSVDMQPDPEPVLTKEDKTMGKRLFQSKTVWVNLLTGAVSVATYLMNSEFIASNPEVVAIMGTVIAVVNIVLRLVTKEPIKGV